MSNEYDISKAFQIIEETLIKSMKRNLTRHLNEENELDMNWSAWQAEQLKSLEHFKKNNKELFKNDFSTINNDVEDLIRKSYENGKLEQEKVILQAIQNENFNSNDKNINKLWTIYKNTKNKRIKKKQLRRIYEKTESAESNFFSINERKLNALIKETTENFQKAELSILRYTNDQYRKIIYNAQIYANTGSGTVQQAVDMATKDFLSKGINSIKYSNDAMVNIAAYAEMAIRTANKRAYLQGEGTKRAEWGVHTVLVPNRGGGCPYCIKFQGKKFIDDVWSGGTEAESKETGYPLLSTAVEENLFHPNCKDIIVTYFPGINSEAIQPTKQQLKQKEENYKNEQKLNYIDRNIKKYSRLELGSIDSDNIEKYHSKRLEWEEYKRKFKENNKRGFKDFKKDGIILNKLGNADVGGTGGTGKGQFIEHIESSTIYDKLKEYEEEIRDKDIEYGILIDSNNDAFGYIGGKNNLDIRDRSLSDVILTHNHPEIGSFGKDDYTLLCDNPDIKELRAVDSENTYILRILKPFDKSYNYFYQKGADIAFRTSEEIQHCVMLELEKEGYIKYDRIRKETKN